VPLVVVQLGNLIFAITKAFKQRAGTGKFRSSPLTVAELA
jgi:hypothetical protein